MGIQNDPVLMKGQNCPSVYEREIYIMIGDDRLKAKRKINVTEEIWSLRKQGQIGSSQRKMLESKLIIRNIRLHLTVENLLHNKAMLIPTRKSEPSILFSMLNDQNSVFSDRFI